MIPVRTFEGKDVAVLGLGRSGIATARALMAGGARGCGGDENEAARKAAAAHPIEETGARLRAMMPWIAKNKLVDKAKN